MNVKSKFSRRDFLKVSAIGAAGAVLMPSALVAAPAVAAAPAKKGAAAPKMINVGFIGVGQQAMYLLDGFLQLPDVNVVACADVYDVKRQRFERRVKKAYDKLGRKTTVKTYEDFQEILARPDVDAVVIATPDHAHAYMAIAACRAGKDVYLEKPLTFTIKEGQELVKAVRENNRIMQVGSQQRSSEEFLHVVNLVREGALGKVKEVQVHVGAPPKPFDLPKMDVPAGLNWDKWVGPLNNSKIHYHSDLNPVITVDPEQDEQLWGAWRWYTEMGGGFTTDWGAHMYDVTQWALGKDGSGPVFVAPSGYQNFKNMTFIYDNGVQVSHQDFDGGKNGVKFIGENGDWIQVCRGEIKASDPKYMPAAKSNKEGRYETNLDHLTNFTKAVHTRVDPNVPVEVAHSSCVMCTLGNIAHELQRPVEWNPIVQKFVNDPEATAKLHYTYRDGYSL